MQPVTAIKRIAIIGEGRMGTGIFYLLLEKHFNLVWICSQGADASKLYRQVEKKVRRSFENGMISATERERQLSATVTTDLHNVHECDLVIEAINENLALKRDLFREVASMAGPQTLMVTNSSSILPSRICPDGDAGKRFAGLHFFYPVRLTNIIELIPANLTSLSTIEALQNFLQSIERRHLLLNETNSFILNRIFLDVQIEAFRLTREGILTIKQADTLSRTFLFNFGFFDFCDSVGIDIMSEAVGNYISGYPDRQRYMPFWERLNQRAGEGKTGIKAGEGFYQYPEGVPDEELPVNALELADYLRSLWLSSIRRFTAVSHIPIDDMNHACIEYFGLEQGPFG